ncbi:DNA excision repair protein ERCC-1 [Episyrphus balteatus]|uniref:DNA excision repair protein ERCC-1 n=1 Tax=Episyrphus balteatus TaxID=286459 RepID=UPI0024858817|nr:DNA excision repair protein ERCC-1 [Episyrphus balteatus]
MDDDDFDDLDDVLANIEIPSAPKIPKIQPTTFAAADEPSTSSSSIAQSQTASASGTNATSAAASNEEKSKLQGPFNSHCIQVHPKQRGNPILKTILNCPYEFRDIVPDYIVGKNACIIYLSLQYHNLHPEYLVGRLKELGKAFQLRVLLVQVDIPEPHKALKSLTRISLLADLTLMLAWNAEEAGKIIETYKLFENKPPDMIMERPDADPHAKLVTALTNIKPVNKTDAVSLLQNFGSLANIINASQDRLSLVTGLGPRKAKKLYETLNAPFLNE